VLYSLDTETVTKTLIKTKLTENCQKFNITLVTHDKTEYTYQAAPRCPLHFYRLFIKMVGATILVSSAVLKNKSTADF
jgi:hypothetical protein